MKKIQNTEWSDICNQPKLLDTNNIFWNKYRLLIFLILYKSKRLSFKELKKYLGTTDGNLASYMREISKTGFININKTFENNYPKTYYSLTENGIHQLRKFRYLISLHLGLD